MILVCKAFSKLRALARRRFRRLQHRGGRWRFRQLLLSLGGMVRCTVGYKGETRAARNGFRQWHALPAALVSPCPLFASAHHSVNEAGGTSNEQVKFILYAHSAFLSPRTRGDETFCENVRKIRTAVDFCIFAD